MAGYTVMGIGEWDDHTIILDGHDACDRDGRPPCNPIRGGNTGNARYWDEYIDGR